MILNRIKEANEVLEDNLQYGDLKKYSNQLIVILTELERIYESSIIIKRKMLGEIKYIESNLFSNQIVEINEVLEKEQEKMISNKINEVNTSRIDAKYNLLNKILSEKWKEYLEAVSRDANNTLSLFEKTQLLDSVSLNKLRYFKKSVDNLEPYDSNVNEKIRSYSDDIRNYVSVLQIDETIQEFLYKIISGNATVQDMNSNIFEWIKKQTMGNHFKVQIKDL